MLHYTHKSQEGRVRESITLRHNCEKEIAKFLAANFGKVGGLTTGSIKYRTLARMIYHMVLSATLVETNEHFSTTNEVIESTMYRFCQDCPGSLNSFEGMKEYDEHNEPIVK